MKDTITLEISRRKIVMLGALFAAMIGLVSLSLALVPMFVSSEEFRLKNNEIVRMAADLSYGEEGSNEQASKVVKDFLRIAVESHDPIIRSVAYSNAGLVLLRDYDETSKKYKTSGAFQEKFPSVKLIGAIEHFSQAARICADYNGSEQCFFGKRAQSNLDYAVLIKPKDSENLRKYSSNDDKNSERNKEKRSEQPMDDSSQNSAQAGESPIVQGGKFMDESPNSPFGSIRGALSEEPKDRSVENGDSAPGGSYELPANKP